MMKILVWSLLQLIFLLQTAQSNNWRQQPHLVAEAGSNISLACPGVSLNSYVFLIEWVCEGCQCSGCPTYSHNGYRLLRHNDKTVKWDTSNTRSLGTEEYTLHFSPVNSKDNGVYHCLVNDRGQADIPILLTVQDVPNSPPSRPMISRITSRTVLLTWATPLQDNNAHIFNYRIHVRKGQGNWSQWLDTDSNSTEYLVADLQPFTTYTFRVSAQNRIGISLPSKDSFQTMTHREKPTGAPQFIRSKILTMSRGFELHWEPPTKTSMNGEFMGYIMTYRPIHSKDVQTLTVTDEILKTQNYSLSGLEQHTSYEITLAARNLEGVGPEDAIILKTEDGVPLRPRRLELLRVDSNSVQIKWRKPENIELLGDEILGYRIYIRDSMCLSGLLAVGACDSVEPKTILGKDTSVAIVGNLKPSTRYELRVRGFTNKREGGNSDPLMITTDTANPSPPVISVLNCTGNGDILVEWRRPRVYFGSVDYYMVYFRSDKEGKFSKRKIDIISNNSSDIYIVYLTGLENDTTYNVAVSAVSISKQNPDRLYESRLSVNKYVYLSRGCQPLTRSISLPDQPPSPVILAAVLGTFTVILLIVVAIYFCRRRISRYGFVTVPTCSTHAGAAGSRGYIGEPESDIPGQLFPKHVQGLHASGDMAFHKDFEILDRTARQSSCKLYPDLIGGSGLTDRKVVTVDSWLSPDQFILMSGEGVLLTGSTWRTIWENQVNLIVSIHTSGTRDDLAQISDSKFFGEFQVQVENETVAPDYTARNMKVRKGRHTRTVVQLQYSRWSDQDLPVPQSFISFVKSASATTQSLGGKVLVCSRQCVEGGIFYMSLYSMTRQLEDTGDVNLGAYSRHLAERGIILDSAQSYVELHDSLSFIIDTDFNRKSYAV